MKRRSALGPVNRPTYWYTYECTVCSKTLCNDCARILTVSPSQAKEINKFHKLNEHKYHTTAQKKPSFIVCGQCEDRLVDEFPSKARRYYEKTGRFEELAQLCEAFGLLVEAGRARARGKSQTVKHVTVDINDLLDKIRRGGLIVPYRCPSCGAAISVDRNTNAGGIRSCAYCGTAFDPDAILKVLEVALS